MAREDVFERLHDVLARHAGGLKVLADDPGNYQLAMPPTPAAKREIWVAAVRNGKAYVSFHLMPVYAFPDLLDGISPELGRRMQGKSCFNFTKVDEGLLAELDGLTERGLERFASVGPERLAAAGAGASR